MLTILVAGAEPGIEQSVARLRSMTPNQRTAISEKLKRFDRELTKEQQDSVRAIDRKIKELPPEEQSRYLASLRRYHNWLASLPETARDGLLAKPVGERMAQVRALVAKHPVTSTETPLWMQFAGITGDTPFELAAIFTAWQKLTPQQRDEVEKLPPGRRREAIRGHAKQFGIPIEILPDDFEEGRWIARAEARIREIRSFNPDLIEGLAKNDEAGELAIAKRKAELVERVRRRRVRQFAINLYTVERPPLKKVGEERLVQFLSAMPSWIRAGFDVYPADEARRRLSVVYRLVFPHPLEFKPAPAATTSAPIAARKQQGGGSSQPVGPLKQAPRDNPPPAKKSSEPF